VPGPSGESSPGSVSFKHPAAARPGGRVGPGEQPQGWRMRGAGSIAPGPRGAARGGSALCAALRGPSRCSPLRTRGRGFPGITSCLPRQPGAGAWAGAVLAAGEEALGIAAQHRPPRRWTPVLSRPTAAGAWEEQRGRSHRTSSWPSSPINHRPRGIAPLLKMRWRCRGESRSSREPLLICALGDGLPSTC